MEKYVCPVVMEKGKWETQSVQSGNLMSIVIPSDDVCGRMLYNGPLQK